VLPPPAGALAAVIFGTIFFTCTAESPLRPRFHLAHQLDQCQQVLDSEQGAPRGQGDEGVDTVYVSPRRRQRTYPFALGLSVEHAMLAPRVGVADELELLAGQRMVGVNDTKSSSTVPITCS
jgi:hypothetical protein